MWRLLVKADVNCQAALRLVTKLQIGHTWIGWHANWFHLLKDGAHSLLHYGS